MAYSFSGGTNQGLLYDNLPQLQGATRIIISAWVKRPASVNAWQPYISHLRSGFTTEGLGIFHLSSGSPNPADMRVYIRNGTESFQDVPGALATTDWTHLLMVYNGSLGNPNRIAVYVNGIAQPQSGLAGSQIWWDPDQRLAIARLPPLQGSPDWVTLGSASSSYSDESVFAGVPYDYRVLAENQYGTTPSNIVTAAAGPAGGVFSLAEVGIWTGQTITSQMINDLASGKAPTFYTNGLSVYLPFISDAVDLMGNAGTPTESGTSVVAHPPGITYPTLGGGGGGATNWINLFNATYSGGVLTKTGGSFDQDAGANTDLSFSGDGYIEFVANTNDKWQVIGLGQLSGWNLGHTRIEYQWDLGATGISQPNIARVEWSPSEPTYAVNDVFRIERTGNTIVWKKNGTTVWTKTGVTNIGAVVGLASLISVGSSSSGLDMTGGGPTTPTLLASPGTYAVVGRSASLDSTSQPPPGGGNVINVPAGGNFQAALNNAQPGDTIKLQAGATWFGEFSLPAKPPGAAITITSSAPLPNRRISPADEALLPRLGSGGVGNAIYAGPTAKNWKIDGVRFMPNAFGLYNVVFIEKGDNIYFDRCLFLGQEPDGQRRVILGNGTRITVTRSHFDNVFRRGEESNAYCAYDGAGPHTITDNFFEVSGINVFFGGAASTTEADTPADILVEHNHLTKRWEWKEGPFQATVKNLFELKNAKRALIRYNLMERNWTNAQNGYAVLFSTSDDSALNPWTVIEHVTFEHNIVRDTEHCFNISGHNPWQFGASQTSNNLVIRHNLVVATGNAMQIGSEHDSITVEHNTFVGNRVSMMYGGWMSKWGEAPRNANYAVKNYIFRNNLTYGDAWGDGAGFGTGALNTFVVNLTWTHNVLAGADGQYPAVTWKPTVSQHQNEFQDLIDWHLKSTSTYKNAGSDGLDLGRIIDAVAQPIHRTIVADAGVYTITSPQAVLLRSVQAPVEPPPIPAGYVLTVDGTTQSHKAGTLSIVETTNGTNTCSFELISLSGSYRPAVGHAVVFTGDNERLFAGEIVTAQEFGVTGYGGSAIGTRVQAVDNNALASKRVYSGTIAPGTTRQALAIVLGPLASHGVSMDPNQIQGIMLPELVYEDRVIGRIFDEIAMANGGMVWEIDYFKVFRMFHPGTAVAPFPVTAAGKQVVGDLTVEPTQTDYANRIIVRAGTGQRESADWFHITQQGIRTLKLSYPLLSHFGYVRVYYPPHNPNIYTDETLSGWGEGGTWQYEPFRGTRGGTLSGNSITAVNYPLVGPGLPVGTVVVITYVALFPFRVQVDDTAAQAARGIVEKVIEERDIFDKTIAQAVAQAHLVRHVNQPRVVSYSTFLHGVRPGQLQPITIADRQVSGQHLITEVEIRDTVKHTLQRRIQAVTGTIYPGSWRDLWRGFRGGGGGTGGVITP